MDIDLTFILQFLIFLVALVGLNGILIKPIQAVIEERERKIKGANDDADRLSRLASEDRAVYEARIQDARGVAQREREALQTEGRNAGRDLVSGVREEISAEVAQVRTQVGEAERTASVGLTSEVDGLARQVVEKVLGRPLASEPVGVVESWHA